MINVTYVGDVLVAHKVTGDKNVPKNKITFQADLNPLSSQKLSSQKPDEYPPLGPIELTELAAKKWGTKQLLRHHGLGQVAEEGFVNNQWMEGQLIFINKDYFSFAWLPIEHQVFFGRASPELTLKMLRDSGFHPQPLGTVKPPELNDDVDKMKDFASRCLEITSDTMEDEFHAGKVDPYSSIWQGDGDEERYFE
jgi:hypothetical protein